MNETPTPETDATAENALKRRLLYRIVVAAVVMAGLLGSLAIFDAIYAPKPAPATRVAALPPAGETPPAVEPVKAEPEPAAAAQAETAAEPEGTASPGAPPLQPLPEEKPLTPPASGRPASIRPSAPVPAAPVARELAQPATRHAPASRPISGAGERQFALQVGVFGNLANAEDLRAKLELNGIPSSIEARVRVGPFRTREEVDAARAKLKELGLEGSVLIAMKAKSQ